MGRDDLFQTVQYQAPNENVGGSYDALPLLIVLIAAFIFYRRRNLITGTAEVISSNRIIVGGQTIRLYAIYGLLHEQPWIDKNGVEFDGGHQSKEALSDRIDGLKVKCWIQPDGGKFGGAKVCRVYQDGEDISEWMVREGHAVTDIEPERRKVYLKAETKARKKGLGIHQGTFRHPLIWYVFVKQRENEEFRKHLNKALLQQLDEDPADDDEAFQKGMRMLVSAVDGGFTEAVESTGLIEELIR